MSSKCTIYAMKIKWKFHAEKYSVRVSNDRKNFFDVYTSDNGTGDREIPICTFTARYVRIFMEKPAKTVNGQSVSGRASLSLSLGPSAHLPVHPSSQRSEHLTFARLPLR